MKSMTTQTYAIIPMLILLLAACSQHRSIDLPAGDSQAQEASMSQEFPIEVRAAGQDPGSPSTDGNPLMSSKEGDTLTEYTTTGVAVQWTKRLPFPASDHSPEIFMVFPQKVFGQQIHSLTYHSSVLNVQDQPNSLKIEESAIPDDSLGIWSVPLFRTFGSTLSALDTGVLHVRINLVDGASREVEVRFNTVPALPDPKEVLVTQSGPEFNSLFHAETLDELKTMNSQGRVVGQQTFRNPTSRPLVLWFHDLGSNLILSQQVSYHVAVDPEITPGTAQLDFEPNSQRFSLVKLNHWIMTSNSGVRFDIQSSAQYSIWKSMTLQPKQTVSLSWRVFPEQAAAACAPHGSVPYSMPACLIPGLYGRFLGLKWLHDSTQSGDCGDARIFMMPETASEVVTGTQVMGQYSQEVILAEAGFDPSGAASVTGPSDSGLSERIWVGGGSGAGALGSMQEDPNLAQLPHYSCQGVF